MTSLTQTSSVKVVTALTELKTHLATLDDLYGAMGVLGWDMETHMPPNGAGFRGRQQATLSTLAHRLATDPAIKGWLHTLEAEQENLTHEEKALVRQVKRSYEQEVKLPEALVSELSRVTSEAHGVWVQARKSNNFALFTPLLKRIVALNQQQAEALGYVGSPYNALLETYEPGLTTGQLDPVFEALKEPIQQVLAAKQSQTARPEWMQRPCPKERQQSLVKAIITAMGFNWQAGRLDEAAHPFCSGSTSQDVRLTNRYMENDWTSCIFTALHEAGHGLYEQGIAPHLDGTPLGGGVSLGIHESQSRLWENLVGRSKAFTTGYLLPLLQELAPEQVAGVSAEQFYTDLNRVQPSFIRVEADEVTYNLHVLLRYRIEKQLIEGTLNVDELPEAWNAMMAELFSLTPANPAEGCLQDVHWAHGSFGYFPTYTLGNLYAAQFFEVAEKALPTLHTDLAEGKLLPLRNWLQENIHQYGHTYWPNELAQRVTGKPLQVEPFIRYLTQKFLG